jgi:hypothetical protein
MPGEMFLRRSLALWERRLAYRRARVIAYRKRRVVEEKRDRTVPHGTRWKLALWERRYRFAGRMVRKRRAQLRKRGMSLKAPSHGRAKAIAAWKRNLGWYEQPPGSNRGDGITAAQLSFGNWLVGLAWCGVFVGVGLRAAGCQVNYRVASVAFIEDDARAGRSGFARWISTMDPRQRKHVQPGDVAVLFGRGVHTEGVLSVHDWGCVTAGGNTSPEGGTGSQSNGGISAQRNRPWAHIYGIAVPDYPKE